MTVTKIKYYVKPMINIITIRKTWLTFTQFRKQIKKYIREEYI